jgi:Glycosyltransferase family 17
VRRFACCMLKDELDVLEFRLNELDGKVDRHIVIESPVTHRGVPKPLHFAEHAARFAPWLDQITYVVGGLPYDENPWVREHAQRDAAWQAILSLGAEDADIVLITDVDEIPSDAALAWDGPDVVSLWMRTCLYAVDWEVPASYPLPPTAVAATVGFLREAGGQLGLVRDNRGSFPVIPDGGWHFSWLGGPERQRAKLESSTCHTELLDHPEAELIRSGARYTQGADGGGIPVVPVDVDETWPAWIRERKCPANWYRPREPAQHGHRSGTGRSAHETGHGPQFPCR